MKRIAKMLVRTHTANLLRKRVHDPLKPHPVEHFCIFAWFSHYFALGFFFIFLSRFWWKKLVRFRTRRVYTTFLWRCFRDFQGVAWDKNMKDFMIKRCWTEIVRRFSIPLFIFHTFINSLIVCINTKICIKIRTYRVNLHNNGNIKWKISSSFQNHFICRIILIIIAVNSSFLLYISDHKRIIRFLWGINHKSAEVFSECFKCLFINFDWISIEFLRRSKKKEKAKFEVLVLF